MSTHVTFGQGVLPQVAELMDVLFILSRLHRNDERPLGRTLTTVPLSVAVERYLSGT